MKYLLLAFCIFITLVNISYGSANTKFCQMRSNKNFANKHLLRTENRISFRNQGGIGGQGVCWWHSRFLRNATYLADFRPELPKPTFDQMKKILKTIKKGKKVVLIPGFYNLTEFSKTYQFEIQNVLDNWQLSDGLLKQKWIVGLRGSSSVKASKLKKKMNELYTYVKNGNTAYQKLQIAGIVAHSWLVIDMIKTSTGHILKVVDSNYPNDVRTHQYRYGQESLNLRHFGDFVPYTEKKKELLKLQKAVKKYCK